MAVPIDPTVTTIVTQALKRAGRTTPTGGQIQEATDYALQEVKADIMLVAPTHPNLLVTSTTVTARGEQRYAIPVDHNEQQSITLLDGPDTFRGTAQNGSDTTITLASSFTGNADDIVGKYLIITGGPGIEEYREILAFDSNTKIATVDLPYIVSPDFTSTYLIVNTYTKLWPYDTATEFDAITSPTTLGVPSVASLSGQEFLLYPVPDKSTYGLINRYWADLSKLDETGDLFIQLLREWRSLFTQGIAVKTMQRFDEDRYQLEMGVYNGMLSTLASQTSRVVKIGYRD